MGFVETTEFLLGQVWTLYNIELQVLDLTITPIKFMIGIFIIHRVLDILLFSIDRGNQEFYPQTNLQEKQERKR